jgi:hypothetical protein
MHYENAGIGVSTTPDGRAVPAPMRLSEAIELGHTMIQEDPLIFFHPGGDGVPACGCAIGAAIFALGDGPAYDRREKADMDYTGVQWCHDRYPWTRGQVSDYPRLLELLYKHAPPTFVQSESVAQTISDLHCCGIGRVELAKIISQIEPADMGPAAVGTAGTEPQTASEEKGSKLTSVLATVAMIISLTVGAMLLSAVTANAASFTPYNPTPHAGEVDLDDIIAPFLADGYQRISDDLDTLFPIPGYEPLYLIAWEDLPFTIADNDFNDVVLLFDSALKSFTFVAGYSADTHSWYEFEGVLYLDSHQACCGGITGDFSSLSEPDRMLTWGKPLQREVVTPEPGTWLLLATGWALLWRRRLVNKVLRG